MLRLVGFELRFIFCDCRARITRGVDQSEIINQSKISVWVVNNDPTHLMNVMSAVQVAVYPLTKQSVNNVVAISNYLFTSKPIVHTFLKPQSNANSLVLSTTRRVL